MTMTGAGYVIHRDIEYPSTNKIHKNNCVHFLKDALKTQDCFGNSHPVCGNFLWAGSVLLCH